MNNEKLMHDLVVERLKGRLSAGYKEITFNSRGGPDLVLGNHGLTLAVVQVETQSSISPDRADFWKTLAGEGTKVILMVPKASKVKVMELLWQKGIADRVGVGTYELMISMP
jgi:hypothetical protein